jgi:hypothetical protein
MKPARNSLFILVSAKADLYVLSFPLAKATGKLTEASGKSAEASSLATSFS